MSGGGGGGLNSKNSALKNLSLFAAIFVAFLLIPTDLLAAGGLDKAKTLLDKVIEWLNYLSIGVVTIAILVVGYKVLFGGQTIRECTPIIIGAIIIASAATVANLLMS